MLENLWKNKCGKFMLKWGFYNTAHGFIDHEVETFDKW